MAEAGHVLQSPRYITMLVGFSRLSGCGWLGVRSWFAGVVQVL